MERRKLLIGAYNTAQTGPWTLAALQLDAAEFKASFIEVPGRDGDIDASTSLTDGEPRYNDRQFSATLECSEGTHAEREELIHTMRNQLDGWVQDIVLPDYPRHYIRGRVSVRTDYNDLAHCAVTITARVEPWLYSRTEQVAKMDVPETETTVALVNAGRKSLVPLIKVEGGPVAISYDGKTWNLSEGTYQLPDIILKAGSTSLTVSGSGTLTFTYREAVL